MSLKRWKEFGVKAQTLVVEAFGDKVQDMYEIQALCTDPDAQGRGYASALVEYVLKQVSRFPLHLSLCRSAKSRISRAMLTAMMSGC